MNEVQLHVQNLDRFIGQTMEMARRLDRGERGQSPAQISFENMETFLKALTPNRWVLLRVLHGCGPSSIRALARGLGRDYRGVHADVVILLNLGLVARDAEGMISVPWSRITAEMALDIAASA